MQIVIYVYPGLTMLDAIGPYEVLRSMPNAEVKLVAKRKGEISADSQMVHLHVKHDIEEVQSADILLVPGSTIGFIREAADKKVLDWIRQVDKTSQKTVSVCTGAIILAAAGLLKGKKATTHWKTLRQLEKYGAEPVQERWVEQGKYLTAAGVSAGIDMALYLTGQLSGETNARAAQLAIEYDPAPPFDSGNVDACSPEVIALSEKQMERDAMKDLSLWEMLKHARALKGLKD